MREPSAHRLRPGPTIADADIVALFAPFAHLIGHGVVLAVPGGSDSMGLMHLLAR